MLKCYRVEKWCVVMGVEWDAGVLWGKVRGLGVTNAAE